MAWFAIALVAASFGAAATAKPPANWDGLERVPTKSVDYLYLRPGADFRQYHSIILDMPQVAFRKNWHKEINQSRRLDRISDGDVRRAVDSAQDKLKSTFEKRLSETGLAIVSSPTENALRVSVGVGNVDVTAPEIRSGRSRVYADQAGHATLVIEARDSLSGELLGRVVDHGVAGESLWSWRTSAGNWADFEHLFDDWGKISAKGLKKLMASTPATAQ